MNPIPFAQRPAVRMNNYENLKTIGEGAYGVVNMAKNVETGQLVAIKVIRRLFNEEGLSQTAIREVSLLREVVHPNIVGLMEVMIFESNLCLVFEFMQMDLEQYMRKFGNKKQLDADTVKSFTYQLLVAILFCHRRRVLHRDLKPQNLLIDPENKVLKLADFGLSRAMHIPVRVLTNEVVTLWYRTPEVLLGCRKYYCPVDIWSIGCIFAEMVNGKPIFDGDCEIGQLYSIFKILSTPTVETWPELNELPFYSSLFPSWTDVHLKDNVQPLCKNGHNLLKKMFIYDPASRITAKDALLHDYFKDLNVENLPARAYDP